MVKTTLTLLVTLCVSFYSWSQVRTNFEILVEEDGTSINIQWRSLEEFNIDVYEIYKKNENEGWDILESVQHEDHILSWSVLDTAPHSGTNSYLLRAVEMNGLPHFSGVEHIEFEIPEFEVLVYPNPASDWIVINSEEAGIAFNAELVNKYGISVAKAKSNRGSILIDTSKIMEGIYYIKINNSRLKFNKPVVINHR